MPGDFVTFKDSLKEGEVIPIQVVSIDLYDNCFARIGEDAIRLKIAACDDIALEDLCGIPLTEEILRRNIPEPRSSEDVFWFWDDRKSDKENWYNIRIERDDVNLDVDIRFVHELQHVLRLCRINKEFEL